MSCHWIPRRSAFLSPLPLLKQLQGEMSSPLILIFSRLEKPKVLSCSLHPFHQLCCPGCIQEFHTYHQVLHSAMSAATAEQEKTSELSLPCREGTQRCNCPSLPRVSVTWREPRRDECTGDEVSERRGEGVRHRERSPAHSCRSETAKPCQLLQCSLCSHSWPTPSGRG